MALIYEQHEVQMITVISTISLIFGLLSIWLWSLVRGKADKYSVFLEKHKYISIEPKRNIITAILTVMSDFITSLATNSLLKNIMRIFINFCVITIISVILSQFNIPPLNVLAVIFIIIALFFFFTYRDVALQMEMSISPVHMKKYIGEINLPTRVYIGNSRDLYLKLVNTGDWLVVKRQSTNYNNFAALDHRDGKVVAISIATDEQVQEYLEIELYAAWMTVDGDKKQRQLLQSNKLQYRWNCHFANSGEHVLNLVVRHFTASDVDEIGAIKHAIKVAKLYGLTERQVWIIGVVAGIISGIFAILGVLSQLKLI